MKMGCTVFLALQWVFAAGLGAATLKPPVIEHVSPLWYVATVGPGVTPVFDFGPDDSIHLIWHADESQQENGPVTYARASSLAGPWKKTVLTSGYFYGPGDLRVAKDGSAHASFHDHIGSPRHFVIAPDNTFTEFLILPAGPHDGWDNSLCFGADGRLHMAAVAPVLHGAKSSLEYGVFDGSAWTYSLVPGTEPFMYGLGTSLALDSSDRVHIAFNTADDRMEPGDLMIATRAGLGWELETLTQGGLRGRFPSLAIDPSDRLHLSWVDVDAANPRHSTLVYGVKEGATWTMETVATFEALRLGFTDSRRPLSLLLDRSGAPHVAFSDARTVVYGVREGGSWSLTPVLEASDDLYRGTAVLRLDSKENPAIALWQDGEANPEGTLRFVSLRTQPAPFFHRADTDGSGTSDISDAVRIFGFLFLGAQKPTCLESADTNNSGKIDISDGVFLLRHLFVEAVSPPPPGFADALCGPDPDVPGSAGDLGCEEYPGCSGNS